LLNIFLPALVFVIIWKFVYNHKESMGRWAGLEKEIPWGALGIMIGWFLGVYLLYFMYEFTAEYLKDGTSFFRYSRYYLPGLFPMALISALVAGRLPKKIVIPVMALIVVSGIVFYLQTALNINA
jgi:ABC-type multidrug transport system permease subunit